MLPNCLEKLFVSELNCYLKCSKFLLFIGFIGPNFLWVAMFFYNWNKWKNVQKDLDTSPKMWWKINWTTFFCKPDKHFCDKTLLKILNIGLIVKLGLCICMHFLELI